MKRLAMFATMLCCMGAQALPVAGWNGVVTGCGATFYWTIGSFHMARDLQGACTQAGEDQARQPGAKGTLVVSETQGSIEDNMKALCYYEPKRGFCGTPSFVVPRCPAGSEYVGEAKACFCGRESSEGNGACVPGTNCDESVRRLKQLKVPATDPRHGFYRNQTCIAEKACTSRASMEDKGWLDKVVPAFANPLLFKDGQWKTVMDQCKAMANVGRGLRCQALMATYHIKVDLAEALIKQGCGTPSDWNRVGDIISTCVQMGVKEDIAIDAIQPLVADLVEDTVDTARDSVRAQCLASRNGKGS